MKKILCFIGLLMLSGCVTNASYEMVNDTLRKVSIEEEGKVTSSHYEMRDKDTGRWFEAEEKAGTWVLTPAGIKARKASMAAPGGC